MNRKSLLIAAALSLVVVGCSSDTSVTTTVPVSPTTVGDTSAPAPESTSTTASPTTTVPPTTTTTAEVPETLTIDISYVSGAVEGGGRVEVPLGEPVIIRIDSDVADEGHLHGYDIYVDVEPGSTGTIEFVADIPGIFELELEGAGVLLVDLEVAP